MTSTTLPIALDEAKLAEFCYARGIRKLSLFGSVLRDDYDPARSDVDVLAGFLPAARPGVRAFGYGEKLAAVLGVRVDVNTPAMLSRHVRERVLAEAVTIYEQP
jgi:predicted nucleotidyltransferase